MATTKTEEYMSDSNFQREEIFAKSVRAGKRTYFFDVKTTKSNDYYMIITESIKQTGDDGSSFYLKHKIFIYREDFDKFMDGMNEAYSRAKELKKNQPSHFDGQTVQPVAETTEKEETSFTDVSFEDLK